MARLTYDIEVYVNYFLAFFYDMDTKQTYCYRLYNDNRDHFMTELEAVLKYNTIYTFNGNNYDIPLTTLYIACASNLEVKRASDQIINEGLMPWVFERRYNIKIPKYDHIDLINVAFGSASLKIYGARIGCKLLQELPIHFNNFIMPHEVVVIDDYCANDNIVTEALADEVKGELKLREKMSLEYGIDLRSKSDAQIAEEIIKSEYFKATGQKLKKTKAEESYRYKAPPFIFFEGEQLQTLYNTCAGVDFFISKAGKVLTPKEVGKIISIGDKKYKMGIGGLHSVDKNISFFANDDYELVDIDVASQYPRIILNSGLEPAHIGSLFTIIYKSFVDRRLEAKSRMKELYGFMDEHGETPELKLAIEEQDVIQASLKIVINGLYGKFGNKHSVVYSPDLMFHTTITGQLSMFMLIEQFVKSNIQVVSANTDGIVLYVHKEMKQHLVNIVNWWQTSTGFEMEYTNYKSIHFRDGNNYIAVKKDGKMKGKGIFASDGIRKNPANSIIRDASMAFIKDGTSCSETINNASDIKSFITVKKVEGGAEKDSVPLGKAIRWYRSVETTTAIHYALSGNQVASSERSVPIMNLPDYNILPPDVDKQWYIDESNKTLAQLNLIKSYFLYHYSSDSLMIVYSASERDQIIMSSECEELEEKAYRKIERRHKREAKKLEKMQ